MTSFEQVDRVLVLSANQLAGQNVALDKLIYDIANSPLLKGGVFLAAYWWLWFEAKDGVREQRRDVVVGLLAASLVAVASRLLADFPALPPAAAAYAGPRDTPRPRRQSFTLNAFSSFPSDHAALFFALSVPLWRRSHWLGAAAALWTVLVICLPRVYLGYHWPSDVVAGAAMGVVLMLVLCRLIGATALPDGAIRFSASHPPAFYALAWLFSLELAALFVDVRAFLLDAAHLAKALV